MSEIVYATSRSPLIAGRRFFNAAFFTAPEPGVTKVFLIGDHPKIRDAYVKLNIPVERLDLAAKLKASEPAAQAEWLSEAVPLDERAQVFIPEDWADLPYNKPEAGRDLTLRGIARMVSEAPITSKAEAIAAIEAELARRAAD